MADLRLEAFASLSDFLALRERFVGAIFSKSALESKEGVGGLSEKTLHRVLKAYLEPDSTYHEVEVLGKVADICRDGHIYEIQRASFSHLVPKLARYLGEYSVDIVHPIVAKKRIKWIDTDSGEISEGGRYFSYHSIYDTGRELFAISEFLLSRGLRVVLPFVKCDEYRYLDGKGKSGRIKASKIEMMPIDLLDQITLSKKEDYLIFLPEDLPDGFTADEYKKSIRSRSRYSYYCLRLLLSLGILRREKEGRAYRYFRV